MRAESLHLQAGFRMSREAAVGTLAALAAVAAIAWGVTIDRMVGMDAGPGTDLGSLGWFFVGWM